MKDQNLRTLGHNFCHDFLAFGWKFYKHEIYVESKECESAHLGLKKQGLINGTLSLVTYWCYWYRYRDGPS